MPEEPTGHRFGMVKSEDLRKGQRVVYHPVGHAAQTSIGKIIRIITHPEEVGIRHTVVKASEEQPRYVKDYSYNYT